MLGQSVATRQGSCLRQQSSPRCAAPVQHCRSKNVAGSCMQGRVQHGHPTCHGQLCCRASLVQHPANSSEPWSSLRRDSSSIQQQQQQQQVYTRPNWHPRLFGVHDSKRAALQAAAQQYYQEVWNAGAVDELDELAADGVCFNDALGMEEDAFSRASLKALIREFQASHPLLRYDVEDVFVDEERDMVVVHYTVTAAHLLPQPGTDVVPTGHVSVVGGMDKIQFNRRGQISSILSFRQRFSEEEVEFIDWESV